MLSVIGCLGSGECPNFLEPASILLTRKCFLGSSPWNSLLAKATADTVVIMVEGAYRAPCSGHASGGTQTRRLANIEEELLLVLGK